MKILIPLGSLISGSIGNLTGSQNRGGSYLKEKPNPRNPDTPNQRVVRGGMQAANPAWRALTELQRVAWKTYAASISRRNQIGHLVTVTGWNAFARMYIPFTQGTVTIPKDAPVLTGLPAPFEHTTSVTNTAAGLTFTLTNSSALASAVIVYQGKSTNPTINNYSRGYNYQGRYAVAAGAAQDVVIPGVFGEGNRFWIRFVTYDDTGRVSNHQNEMVTIPALT